MLKSLMVFDTGNAPNQLLFRHNSTVCLDLLGSRQRRRVQLCPCFECNSNIQSVLKVIILQGFSFCVHFMDIRPEQPGSSY